MAGPTTSPQHNFIDDFWSGATQQQQQDQQPQQQEAAGDPWGNPFADMTGGQPHGPAPRHLQVDQVAEPAVNAWFAEADRSHSGLLSGQDAINFFWRSGLSQPDLSRVWNVVKATMPSQGAGLSREQFSGALRFGGLLPPPRLASAPAAASPTSRDGTEGQVHSSPVAIAHPHDNHHGCTSPADVQAQLSHLSVNKGHPGSPLSGKGFQVGSPNGSSICYEPPRLNITIAPPVCFEARLPPLKPKETAQLTLLAAGHGSLFAGPSVTGGLLQWARPEGNMRQPNIDTSGDDRDVRLVQDNREDADAAPAFEIKETDCKKVTCMCVDQASAMLWVGHSDGRVSGFSLKDTADSAINNRRKYSWQAHKLGAVTSVAVSGWGELWTGSSRGNLRVWSSPGDSRGSPGYLLRELRRNGGARPHGSAVTQIIFPCGGQVVWTAGDKSLLLWCAFSGLFLGSIHHKDEPDELDQLQYEGRKGAKGQGEEHEKKRIDSKKGLDLDSTGRALNKPHFLNRDQTIAEQQAWANQSDKKTSEFLDSVHLRGGQAFHNAGKAAKFISKGMGKLVRNMVEDKTGLQLPHRTNSATSKSTQSAPDLAGEWDLEGGGAEALEGGSFRDRGGNERAEDKQDKKSGSIALVAAGVEGEVWVSYKRGRLEKYTAFGKLVARKDLPRALTSFAAVGGRVWVGSSDGSVKVIGQGGQGSPVRWQAHSVAVVAMAQCGSRVYTLALDGSLKGWASDVPGPFDVECRREFKEGYADVVALRPLEVVCLTWNVGEGKPSPSDSNFFRWLAQRAASAAIVVVGLQEIEMGSGSVALAAARDRFAKKEQEKGNANGQWWEKQVHAALGCEDWSRVGMRQLSGMLILVFARTALKEDIGEVRTASVACGVLGVGGNKGATAVAFSLFRRQVACVCSHFAAHQGAVDARNRNYAQIVKDLKFSRRPWYTAWTEEREEGLHSRLVEHLPALAHGEAAATASAVGSDSDTDSEGGVATPDDHYSSHARDRELVQGQGMRDAELLIWMGDFNYRIDVTYEVAKDKIRRNTPASINELLEKDQLKIQHNAGRIFHYLREGTITFRPTYKFDKGDPTALAYDSSDKRRVPAWCDRILFRGSECKFQPQLSPVLGSDDEEAGSVSHLMGEEPADEHKGSKPDDIIVRPKDYNACMDVFDSDHKPVWAALAVDIPCIHHDKCRRLASHVLKATAARSTPPVPLMKLSTDSIILRQVVQNTTTMTVTNMGVAPVLFSVCRAGADSAGDVGGAGVPSWLEIYPLDGVLFPQASAHITLSAAVGGSVSYSKVFKINLCIRVDHEYGEGGLRSPQFAKADQVGADSSCDIQTNFSLLRLPVQICVHVFASMLLFLVNSVPLCTIHFAAVKN
ncbi:hypothetical protein WJX73_007250 [Symbiochloris irregularis]|uniref:Inositol polyphosphate-related phosphatase domain-containing protein n=1 Tax=Symbiochloris irregularis TaxID=706552 RepID=A0AAW1NZ19_9CHLO